MGYNLTWRTCGLNQNSWVKTSTSGPLNTTEYHWIRTAPGKSFGQVGPGDLIREITTALALRAFSMTSTDPISTAEHSHLEPSWLDGSNYEPMCKRQFWNHPFQALWPMIWWDWSISCETLWRLQIVLVKWRSSPGQCKRHAPGREILVDSDSLIAI